MELWRGSYRGIELGWKSPVAQPVNPAFVNQSDRNGLGWLAGFNEWLCRCENGPLADMSWFQAEGDEDDFEDGDAVDFEDEDLGTMDP